MCLSKTFLFRRCSLPLCRLYVCLRMVQNWTQILRLARANTSSSDSLGPVTWNKRVASRVQSRCWCSWSQFFKLNGLNLLRVLKLLQVVIAKLNVLIHRQLLNVVLLLLLRVLRIRSVLNVYMWCFQRRFTVRLRVHFDLIRAFSFNSSSFETGFLT